VKNGDETDVDCGGACPTKCLPTKKCKVAADCKEGVCGTDLLCAAPTSSDTVKNGNETDVDCGTSTAGGTDTGAPRCDAGLTCVADADCKSAGCNYAKKCAFARSCTPERGGTTCGTGDYGAATKQHEDCCASAEVPVYNEEGYANATAFRLDKYTITSGRMRRFLDAVNGNVKAWVQANRANILAPNQLPDTLDDYLPAGWTQPDSGPVECDPDGAGGDAPRQCNYGALAQVSGYRYNNGPGGDNGYGCYMGTGASGSRTFYMTDAERALMGNAEGQHVVPRERVEEKALTCVTYYMLAAFCAWDGGRLETFAEYNAAYGGASGSGRRFPWGAEVASRSLGFATSGGNTTVGPTNNYPDPPPAAQAGVNNYSVFNQNLSTAQKDALLLRLTRANHSWNYQGTILFDYLAPLQGRASAALPESTVAQANDQSVAVAPPGRYPMGAGRYGHRDLLGNVLEMTATPGVATPTGNRQWGRNGSFETSHYDANTMLGYNGYNFDPRTKYGRTGGRCARPLDVYPATILP